MLRGLYTAASGMMTEQRRHDTVTQNIANINTPGYKQVNAVAQSFPDMLISLVGDQGEGAPRKIGKLTTGVFAAESLASYTQGDLRETGKNSDFALVSDLSVTDPATGQPVPFDASGKYVNEDGEVIYQPQAFFAVMDGGDQVRYTRNGTFTVNEAGELRTSQGYRVLDSEGNPIVLDPLTPADSLKVDRLGNMQINGNTLQLGISVVTRPQEMVREGNGIFRVANEDGTEIRPLEDGDFAEVRQGYLEASNVDTAQSMVDLLAAQRAYESNQKVIQFYDKSMDKAVNEIGRV